MNRINDVKMLNNQIKVFKDCKKYISNLPVSRTIFDDLVTQKRLYTYSDEKNLLIYVDELKYYNLFYLLAQGFSFSLGYYDKDLLINENIIIKDYERIIFNDLYLQNGFDVESVNYQVVINIKENREDIIDNYHKSLDVLNDRGYIIEHGKPEDYKEIAELWLHNLKPTDVPYNHFHNGRVLVLKNKDTIIGVVWYNIVNRDCEFRHLVVDKNYRRQGIAKFLCYTWLYKMLKSDINRGMSWIEKDNIASFKIHEGLGFRKNNRICVQYVLKYKERYNREW